MIGRFIVISINNTYIFELIRWTPQSYTLKSGKPLTALSPNPITEIVADPGFLWGGGANPPGRGAPTYDFAKISQKLHEIERIWTPACAHPSCPLPLRSANESGFMLSTNTIPKEWKKKSGNLWMGERPISLWRSFLHVSVQLALWIALSYRISTRLGANPPGVAPTYDFAKFSQKPHEIERIWPRGARVSRAPLRSANAYGHTYHCNSRSSSRGGWRNMKSMWLPLAIFLVTNPLLQAKENLPLWNWILGPCWR